MRFSTPMLAMSLAAAACLAIAGIVSACRGEWFNAAFCLAGCPVYVGWVLQNHRELRDLEDLIEKVERPDSED